MKKISSHARHIAKALSWRLLGTLDTFMLAWLVTGDHFLGFKIGGVELFTKTLLFYLHERGWYRLHLTWKGKPISSKTRHLLKTVSYRIVGTIDTIIIAWIITDNPFAGLKIGVSEVGTKMFLYYLHERLWYHINFGLEKRQGKEKGKGSVQVDEKAQAKITIDKKKISEEVIFQN